MIRSPSNVRRIVDEMEKIHSSTDRKIGSPFIVAIDGPCAGGKTTLAQALKGELSCPVITMDHFFLPPSLRSAQRLAEPGGNIHYERFERQVLQESASGREFSYDVFDCSMMAFGSKIQVPPSPVLLLEGSYSHHPRWRSRIDLAVFLRVSPAEQKRRLIERAGTAGYQTFEDRWIPLENQYFSFYRICEHADLILKT